MSELIIMALFGLLAVILVLEITKKIEQGWSVLAFIIVIVILLCMSEKHSASAAAYLLMFRWVEVSSKASFFILGYFYLINIIVNHYKTSFKTLKNGYFWQYMNFLAKMFFDCFKEIFSFHRRRIICLKSLNRGIFLLWLIRKKLKV